MSGEEVRRRWRTLTAEQTAMAGELLARATEFLDRFGDLSVGEAIELAAEAIERRRLAELWPYPKPPGECDSAAVTPESGGLGDGPQRTINPG